MALSDVVASIKFRSIAETGEQFRKLNLDLDKYGPAVGEALKLSSTKGLRLTKGILLTVKDIEELDTGGTELVNWARNKDSPERMTISKAFVELSADLYLVTKISEMTRPKAHPFMSDYLSTSGTVKPIAKWLSLAGRVLRKHRLKGNDTAGWLEDLGDWAEDKIEDAVDALSERVESVVDSVVSAGKALVDIVSEVVSWSIEEVSDLEPIPKLSSYRQ